MPDVYVDKLNGDDVANDGSTEALAFETIQAAIDDGRTAGDTIWVQGTADYLEDVLIQLSGTGVTGTAANPITIEGYTTTPGDGGKATIDGENTRANCISADGLVRCYRIRNFIFTGCTGPIINDTGGTYFWEFENCEATDGTGSPTTFCSSMRECSILNCLIENMSSHGLNLATARSWQAVDNIIRNNGGDGIFISSYRVVNLIRNQIYGNTGDGIDVGSASDGVIIGNTIDDNTDGIDISGSNHQQLVIRNNVISNHTDGIDLSGPSNNGLVDADFNAYYNNSNNTNGSSLHLDGDNDVQCDSDPYEDDTNNDYTPNNVSDGGARLRGAGDNGQDIGAVQHVESAGSTRKVFVQSNRIY